MNYPERPHESRSGPNRGFCPAPLTFASIEDNFAVVLRGNHPRQQKGPAGLRGLSVVW